jgi:cysteine sulfinate desulfinase/cysteine desulfurase-like protein
MGLDPEACRQSIRISLGRDANIVETKYISGKISDALRKLSMQG